jgi:hypothetical protein
MTSFDQFRKRCKMRLDFDDQIQVRYAHFNGEHFDAWVSGEEALRRLESTEAEEQLRSLSRLSADDVRIVLQSLPDSARKKVRSFLRDEVADRLESGFGGNPIGDALVDAVRGRTSDTDAVRSQKERWLALMRFEPFRQRVFELAWIQLEGSFPDHEPESSPDEWL